jgi:Flp pilus assembly pilin Flp
VRTTSPILVTTARLAEIWRSCMARLATISPPRGETGASLVEYTLLLSLIALVALVAITFLGHAVTNSLNNSAGFVNNP